MSCPCGSELNFDNCCDLYLKGAPPKTAEQLMRSRYVAYTLGNIDYIEKTHDPRTINEFDRNSTESWSQKSEWLGLEIINCVEGEGDDKSGTVEFKVRYILNGKSETHHELSTFVKHKNKWFFSTSKTPDIETFVRQDKKIGRNDPCSCGSGKKHKKCCG